MAKIIWIILGLLMLPIALATVEAEYSLDNTTWQNFTYNSNDEFTEIGLNQSTTYYVRMKNSSTLWGYTTIQTQEAIPMSFDTTMVTLFGIIGIIALGVLAFYIYKRSKLLGSAFLVVIALTSLIPFNGTDYESLGFIFIFISIVNIFITFATTKKRYRSYTS